MTEDADKNRRCAEALFGKSLDGFCICAANGARARDRDFDSIEEAQRYIDLEDERLQPLHKSKAQGVNIQPCVKAHPNFLHSEEASAMLLEALPSPCLRRYTFGWVCYVQHTLHSDDAQKTDRKTAIRDAFLVLLDTGWRPK